MTGTRILLIGVTLSLFFSGCAAKKKTKNIKKHSKTTKSVSKPISRKTTAKTKTIRVATPINKKSLTTLEYIEQYSPIAVNHMKVYKIPASIKLAQGILESRSGNSDLTKDSNNHFGIKCHKSWTGSKTYYDDDEKGECFRVYEHASHSYNDHSLFLADRKRYSSLFKLDTRDYKAWARGLRKAGYATDKQYPQKLISIIEKYELHKYDQLDLSEEEFALSEEEPDLVVHSISDTKTPVTPPENTFLYIVNKGEGLYTISRRFKMEIEEIKSINNLDSNSIHPGQHLYLKFVDIHKGYVQKNTTKLIESVEPDIVEQVIDTIPPAKKTHIEKAVVPTPKPVENPTYHIVKKGETLYQIAYKYDLSIPDFRSWNGILKNRIKVGQKLFVKRPEKMNKPAINNNIHTVLRGETLYSISKKYGLSVPELKLLNNLTDNSINVDQVLIIKQ